VHFLSGVGLGSPVTWIQPAKTLSNGQQSRAEVALQMARTDGKFTVIDEFTSVVDRTVAKAMSHSVQKVVRKNQKRIVLISCHYDIVDWLNPDWIIDCNTQDYIDRRLKCPRYSGPEQLIFRVRELRETKSWASFSRYHYLSDKLAGGKNYLFGLFTEEEQQIGFIAYSNYVLHKQEHKDKNLPMIMHANRIVVHPDYCGFGLGGKLTDITADYMKHVLKYDVQIKLSSASMANLLKKNTRWELRDVSRNVNNIWGNHVGRTGRIDVKTYSFKFLD
jgi:hemerythrin